MPASLLHFFFFEILILQVLQRQLLASVFFGKVVDKSVSWSLPLARLSCELLPWWWSQRATCKTCSKMSSRGLHFCKYSVCFILKIEV